MTTIDTIITATLAKMDAVMADLRETARSGILFDSDGNFLRQYVDDAATPIAERVIEEAGARARMKAATKTGPMGLPVATDDGRRAAMEVHAIRAIVREIVRHEADGRGHDLWTLHREWLGVER